MGRGPLEKTYERKFSEEINKEADTLCIKVHRCHWPDRLISIGPDNMYWIEFKRLGESLRKGQALQIKRLREQGHRVYVCRSLQEARKVHAAEVHAAEVHAAEVHAAQVPEEEHRLLYQE